jgi:hypothetical protein
MEFDRKSLSIALVDRSEFGLARSAIADFEPWAAYEDYRGEREARLISLAAAGQRSRLATVSIRAFLDWCAASDRTPSMEGLEAFAASHFAADPRTLPVRTTGACFTPAALQDSVGAEADLASYREWLECLQQRHTAALYDAYVALVRERQGEQPLPSEVAE